MSVDRVKIMAEPRVVAKGQAQKLRRQGIVPGIIYGQREQPVHVQMEAILLRRALRQVGTTQLADVMVNDEKYTVLVRDIQQHVTRGDVLHVDFYEVDLTSTIMSEAELVSVGMSQPTREGIGTPVLILRSVEIECQPDSLISEIEVDFDLIKTPDDVIYVGDLPVPSGVKILTEPEEAVTSFEYTKLEEEEEEEEEFIPAADAVEVIGRGKDEEEEFEE